ncbi:MAG: PepSY-associated TM helix domain-containing protein [Pseudomonadota bacterium]
MFRKTIFWMHLSAGVLAGIVVMTMSVTGVLLTYERQMKRWAAESNYVPAEQQGTPLSLEQLLNLQQLAKPDVKPNTVVITNDAGAPVSFRAGRNGTVDMNPYDGSLMQVEAQGMADFFGVITRFHRWFNIEGENRDIARQITGVSNVLFLFLVLSGMYLWFPAIWKSTMFKARAWLRSDYPNSKVRDFHWHHIFGIWMAIPLALVVYSGMVISYPWAANAMYRVFGAEIPAPQGQPQGAPPVAAQAGQQQAAPQQTARREGGPGGESPREAAGMSGSAPVVQSQPLDTLLAAALADSESKGWERLTLTLPAPDAEQLQIEIDLGNGAQAQLRHTLSLDRESGAIVSRRGFAELAEAQRLRGIARFLHTGEVLGFWGQTIAGLASAAAVLLVWTGLALAWRRLIVPLYRKNPA